MKDRMERCVVLPFSLGCWKHSSVAVADTHPHKKPNQLIKRRDESNENGFVQKEDTKMENNGANISDGLYKIIRSFKSFSHFCICHEEAREEGEGEMEMEIGFPTNVKHLSHIGLDGTMTTFDVSSSPFPFANFHLTAV